jgi:hypothetical protein
LIIETCKLAIEAVKPGIKTSMLVNEAGKSAIEAGKLVIETSKLTIETNKLVIETSVAY